MVMTAGLNGYSDIHFTNERIAKAIVDFFNPSLPCLEPCCGDGAFLKFLPRGTDWCEISRGRDFFKYDKRVAWIVTNPPFGNLTGWMEHSFCLADNVVFLMPLSKLFSSYPRMELVRGYGGIRTILSLGSGRAIGFDIGFPFGAIHFKGGYGGRTRFVYSLPSER